MKRLAFILFLILAAVLPASADTFAVGYVTPGGYVWRGDYWYYGDVPYTRVQLWQQGYYSYPNGYCGRSYGCGCARTYVNGYYYYSYTRYYPPAVAQVPSYKDPGWRSKVADILLTREKSEARIREEAFEQANYMDTLNAVGIRPPSPNIPFYGSYYGNVGFGSSYAVNGSTGYGYNQQSYQLSLQKFVDTEVDFLMVNQTINNAQNLSGAALDKYLSIVSRQGADRAQVAAIMAKGLVVRDILNALNNGPPQETRGYSLKIERNNSFKVEQDPKVVTPEQKAGLRQRFEQLAGTKCAGCHGDDNPKGGGKLFPGGMKIADYFTFNPEQKSAVWESLSYPDARKRMPLGKDNVPGEPLTASEKQLFYQH